MVKKAKKTSTTTRKTAVAPAAASSGKKSLRTEKKPAVKMKQSKGDDFEGRAAPDFNLPSTLGRRLSLADFEGKWLVVYFYPRDLTPGCTIQAEDFSAHRGEFR